jgi:hypothetical protein
MKRVFTSLGLTLFASIPFAQSATHAERITVAAPQDCPANTTANVNYERQNGRLVRNGWICQERINPRS